MKLKAGPWTSRWCEDAAAQAAGDPGLWSLRVASGGKTGLEAAIPRLEATKIAPGCDGSCLQSAHVPESMHMKRILGNYEE